MKRISQLLLVLTTLTLAGCNVEEQNKEIQVNLNLFGEEFVLKMQEGQEITTKEIVEAIIDSKKNFNYFFKFELYSDKEFSNGLDTKTAKDGSTIYLKTSTVDITMENFRYSFDYLSYMYELDYTYEQYLDLYQEKYEEFIGQNAKFSTAIGETFLKDDTLHLMLTIEKEKNNNYQQQRLYIPISKYTTIKTNTFEGSCCIWDETFIAKKGSSFTFPYQEHMDRLYLDLQTLTIYDGYIDCVTDKMIVHNYSYENGVYGDFITNYIQSNTSLDFNLKDFYQIDELQSYEINVIDDENISIKIDNQTYIFKKYYENQYHVRKVISTDKLFENKTYQETLDILNILFGSQGLKDYCIEVQLNQDCSYTLDVFPIVIVG